MSNIHNQLFENIFNHISAPISILSADAPAFTIVALNEQYKQATGTTDKNLIGKSIFEAFTPPNEAGKKQFSLFFEALMQSTESSQSVKLPVLHFDTHFAETGKTRHSYWQIEITPLLNAEGKAEHLMCLTQNITQQEEHRMALNDAAKREQQLHEELAAMNEELAAANEELHASNEQLSNLNGELASMNEDLTATNGELIESQQKLNDINITLEELVYKRTQELLLEKQLSEKQRIKLAGIIANLPVGLAILTGREMVLDIVNEAMLKLWNRDPTVTGKTLLHFMPELKDQAFPQLLDDVYTTGKAYHSQDAAVELLINNQLQTVYMDFSYTPLTNSQGVTDSILILAEDVTSRVLSRQREQELNEELTATNEELSASNEELITTNEELISTQHNLEKYINELAESESRFRNMVKQAPVAIGILTGRELVIESANSMILRLWGKTEHVIGSPLAVALPELQGQPFLQLLDDVYTSGIAVNGYATKALLEHEGILTDTYFDFIYHPLKDDTGTTSSIIVIAVDVTAQVMAKMQMEEAEERARLAVDAVGLGTFDLNLTTKEIITSERFARILGFNQPQPLSNYTDLIHPEDREIRKRAAKEAMTSGKLVYEVRIIRPDNVQIWIKVDGKVFYDAELKPVRILGILLDITEQRLARKQQQKLITLVNNSVDLMSVLDFNGINTYINEAGRKLLGFESDEEIANTPVSELHPPEYFEQVKQIILPTVMSEGRWSGTMMVKHLKTGEIFPVLNNTMRIDHPVTGKPLAIGAVMRDLRPELAAKKALADSEALLRNITTAAPTALWMSDTDGAITYVNQTWINWSGQPFEDNLGDGWVKAIHPDDMEKAINKYLSDFTSRSVYEVEFRIENVEGVQHWYLANGMPYYDAEGNFTGYIGACIDITEQKQLQQHKDDFISIASHELKTPITSLKASLQLLNRVKDNPSAKMLPQLIEQSNKSMAKISTLIDDLLSVSRINSGQLNLNKTVFTVAHMLQECCSIIKAEGKHQLIVQADDNLQVFADEHKIEQVITNFVNNAVKYAPESKYIYLAVEQQGNMARISVKDNGPGIAPNKLPHLFERYYRAEASSAKYSGLGLGLYICSDIIHRHGGQIGVESQIGQGSTFWFTVPLKINEA